MKRARMCCIIYKAYYRENLQAIFVNTLVYCYDEEAEEKKNHYGIVRKIETRKKAENEHEEIVKGEKAIESESN